jgi:hypothetical protein
MAGETITKSRDFQAEYEGSIPFTRSKQFQWPSRRLPLYREFEKFAG